MDFRAMYVGLEELQQQLVQQTMHEAEVQLTLRQQYRTGPDYRTVQALAACYTLQDYVAARLGEQDADVIDIIAWDSSGGFEAAHGALKEMLKEMADRDGPVDIVRLRALAAHLHDIQEGDNE